MYCRKKEGRRKFLVIRNECTVRKKEGSHLLQVGCTRIKAVPTQFKATQLVVAIAVWANAISARGAHPNLSILLLNNASEQYYITIG